MHTKSYGQSFFGLALVAVGTGFLLSSLHIIDLRTTIGTWWPSIIILVGLASLLSNPRLALWPTFIIGLGVLFQLRQLNIIDFNIWNVIWPSAVIIFGLSLVFGRAKAGSQTSSENRVDTFVAFSGLNAKNDSQEFQGGKMSAVFGGIELDLREAAIKDKAVIEAFSAFGGIEIKVPEGWNVITNGLPLFGGWEDKTKKSTDKSAPTLHIRGTCLFGGIGIKN